MAAIVLLILEIFLNETHAVLKTEEYYSDVPQF